MITTPGELQVGWFIVIGYNRPERWEMTARVTAVNARWNNGNPVYEVHTDALSWPLVMKEDDRVVARF